jgi:competence protein ComEC
VGEGAKRVTTGDDMYAGVLVALDWGRAGMAVSLADSTWGEEVKGGGLKPVLAHMWELEKERLAIWSPLFLVTGIWSYFSLSREPPFGLAAVLLFISALVFWRWRSNKALIIIAIILVGFGIAKLRVEWIGTSLLNAYVAEVKATGWVSDIDQRGKSNRILIVDVETAQGLPPDEVPRSVRLRASVKPGQELRIGDHVALTASLSPLPRPVAPGAFDYGRQLYFQGVGAVGRAKSGVVVQEDTVPWSYALRRTFHDLRSAIGERVHAVIKGPLGSFAEALITGERATIPKSLNSSLQASGLFHILSISGLHMSLVAGGAFWAVRAALALVPRLALQYPIKKWAAAGAMVVGLLYMLLADSGAATERSFIMIAVVFFAVLVDRPAISLHNLAVAAIIILGMEPEQALSASFQMSFMAVMGLAAFFPAFEAFTSHFGPQAGQGFAGQWTRRLVLLVLASVATSLIAGTLSSIPAAHHFGRIAPFAVVSNALALPIVGLVVMPMAMLGVFLMPLGLEALPLKMVELGLQGVVWISDWVASWPAAQSLWPLLPVQAAILLSLAAVLVCLSASRLRWFAVPCVALAALFVTPHKPLLLFDERGANAALLTDVGYVPAAAKGASYSAGRWLQQVGDDASVAETAKRAGWSCNAGTCNAKEQGMTISYLLRAVEHNMACPVADILLAEFPLRRRCKGKHVTIDRFDVWRNGAHAVYIEDSSLKVATAREKQGARPWVYEPRARDASIFTRKRP